MMTEPNGPAPFIATSIIAAATFGARHESRAFGGRHQKTLLMQAANASMDRWPTSIRAARMKAPAFTATRALTRVSASIFTSERLYRLAH
jgi:hypothetical protein